jgi:ElaB/YqjD/DUF883 family membrane-anchored ribosome-binding protein
MKRDKSPAVESLEQERSSQGARPREAQARGGADNTRKSDPISTNIAATPSLPKEEDGGLDDQDTPLVDLALSSVKERDEGGSETVLSAEEEIEALRSDLAHLNERLAEIGSASVRVAKAQASDALDTARERIRERPLKALGLAALAGYIWGLTR